MSGVKKTKRKRKNQEKNYSFFNFSFFTMDEPIIINQPLIIHRDRGSSLKLGGQPLKKVRKEVA